MSAGFIAEYHEKCKHKPDYVLEGLKLQLGEMIAEGMEKYNMTPKQLARKLKISKSKLNGYLHGKNAKLSVIAKLACVFKAQPIIRLIAEE